MKKARGAGLLYRPTYLDKRTGESKTASTWWIQYSIKGTRFRESSKSSIRQDAERLLQSRLEAAAQGRPVGPATFEQLAEILLDRYRASGRRSVSRVQAALAHLHRFFEKMKADDIDTERVGLYVRSRQEQRAAPATINRELAALRRAFRLTQSEGIVKSMPTISMLREQSRPRGCIEEPEYRAILDNLPEYLQPIIQTAYFTGWRINSEILTIHKHDLDLKSDCLRLTAGEADERGIREFPLTPELREVLVKQLERTAKFERLTGKRMPWLFHRNGQRIKDFRKAWAIACKRADVQGRVPDDLRRSAVRNLEYAGVPRSIAMALVGHRSDSVYRSIGPIDTAELKESASRIAAFHQSRAAVQIRSDSTASKFKKNPAERER